MEHLGVGHGGPDAARLQARACGVVIVAVGGGHRLQQLTRPMGPGAPGQDRRHLNLGVEGDAGDLLFDEDRVEDPLAGLLPAVPGPAANGEGEGDARSHEHGLPGLSRLHPQVASDDGQGRHAQDGHRHAVGLERLGLIGVGGVSPVLHGPLVGLLQVGLRPVGSHRAQHQPRHDALPLVEVGERAHEGDEGVGAWVQQVVVPEDPERHVLGAVGPERHAPRLLVFGQAQGVVLGGNLLYLGLGVAGGDLGAHHLVVQAAGQERYAVHVPGQLQGEGFGDGDGAEHVLDSQERSLPRPGRRHRQQQRGFLSLVVQQPLDGVHFHSFAPFSTGSFIASFRRSA